MLHYWTKKISVDEKGFGINKLLNCTFTVQVSWLIIYLTNNITLILIAVTIAGVGIAGQNISTMFMSEIAHVSIRGALTSITSSGFMTGKFISVFYIFSCCLRVFSDYKIYMAAVFQYLRWVSGWGCRRPILLLKNKLTIPLHENMLCSW